MKGMTIKIERVKRGLTQSQLANQLGISQVLISKLERDIYQPSSETTARIKEIFKLIQN